MIIVSQDRKKITESLEFQVDEKTTCKNIFIDEKTWQKFKKITNKTDNYCSLKELKGLGELIEKDIIKQIYEIKEIENNRVFGSYDTEQKAKEALQETLNTCEKIGYPIFKMPER